MSLNVGHRVSFFRIDSFQGLLSNSVHDITFPILFAIVQVGSHDIGSGNKVQFEFFYPLSPTLMGQVILFEQLLVNVITAVYFIHKRIPLLGRDEASYHRVLLEVFIIQSPLEQTLCKVHVFPAGGDIHGLGVDSSQLTGAHLPKIIVSLQGSCSVATFP